MFLYLYTSTGYKHTYIHQLIIKEEPATFVSFVCLFGGGGGTRGARGWGESQREQEEKVPPYTLAKLIQQQIAKCEPAKKLKYMTPYL